MKILKFVLVVFAFATLFTSCSEDNAIEVLEDLTVEETTTIVDEQEYESELETIVDFADQGMEMANGRVAGTQEETLCDRTVITHDRENKIVVIDFGVEGCVGPAGNLRTGKLTIQYSGDYARDHRGAKQLTFEDYAVNGNGVSGQVHISAWTKNDSGNWRSTVTSSNVVFSFTDGTTFTITAGTRTREVFQGDLGGIVALRITGGADGINRNGRAFSARIADDEPITFKRACLLAGNPYPVAGRRMIQVEGRPQFKIDFGSGNCDRLAIVQIGDQEPLPIVLGR